MFVSLEYTFHSLSNYVIPIMKNKIISASDYQRKRVVGIALVALGFLAACYLVYRGCHSF